MTKPLNAHVVMKGEERYIFLYDDHHGSAAIQMAARWAENKDLTFTWYDAAVTAQRIRQHNAATIAAMEARRLR